MDDPKHKIRGYRRFQKWPTGRQALIVGVLFIILLLIGVITQALGLWPESWNTTFDGTGE
ncbi:hypothetical protein [Hoeflea sp. TYP-13]|uniref:hypothetical protein n=1 Tax=Hoeflea sp. TYP-13 TaxID=3230023 RepID=UPI0034C628F1